MAGLLLSFVVVWYALGLVVTAWQACDIVSAGARFGTVTVVVPALVLVMWVVFSIGVYFTRAQPVSVRFVAGAVLVVAAVLVLVTVMVPDSPQEDYRNLDLSEYPACGPDGVPTWWPTWLPS